MRFLWVISGHRRGNQATTKNLHNHIENSIHAGVCFTKPEGKRLFEDLITENIELNITETG
jgi:hypothetical protein